METIKILNQQIDKILRDYELLRLENESLKEKLNEYSKKNDELLKYSQDMLFKIDNTLTLQKAKSEKRDNISY